jgi:23S rRNA pseudouridine1911/1915/1917 synthase
VRLGWAGSRRAAVELISSGRVRVNGRHYRKGEVIAPGDRVEVIPTATHDALASNPDLKIKILFEDAAVIVADKPALMPCHPLRFDERDTVMNAIVAAYPETALAGDKALEGGLIHRLDNGTSGALMVARTHEAFTAMREALRAARVMRRYRALVTGRFEGPMEIAASIAHHPKNPRKMVLIDTMNDPLRSANVPTGMRNNLIGVALASSGVRYRSHPRPAYTLVETLSHDDGYTIVEVTPRTGNRHQIRVHLSCAGFPIAGDELYDGPPLAGLVPGRFWLHLREVGFESPTGTRVKVIAPLAPDLEDSIARLH